MFMSLIIITSIFPGCAVLGPAPIKIGVLYPLTGPVSMAGKLMTNATDFAFEQVGYEIAGRKIELIFEDEGYFPDIAIDKVRKLLEHDKVDVIIGPLQAGHLAASATITSKAGIPHLSPGPQSLKMSKYEWLISPMGSAPQIVYPMGLYAYDELGFRTVTILAEDTASGHHFIDPFIESFKSKGGKIIQEQYTPFPTSDFAPYLTKLEDADAVVAWESGAQGILFLTQYHEFGGRKRMPVLPAYFGAFYQPMIVRNLKPEVADAMIGEYANAFWTPLIELDESKQFINDFEEKFGFTPTDVSANPYSVAQIVVKALEATGGDTTPGTLREAILAVDFISNIGRVHFDAETKFAYRDLYICKLDKIGEEYVFVPIYTYKDVHPRGH
jgi:branched-chain amino acid transport system substrate-binding protein